jgi:hypothetical protein
MKIKKLLPLLFTLVSSHSLPQSIEELEYSLNVFENGVNYSEKINRARKLLQVDAFNYTATRYLFDYYEEVNIDSVSAYFDGLFTQHPHSVEARLLRSELLFYEHDHSDRANYATWQLLHLKDALEITPENQYVLYEISKVYYDDFIYPFEKPRLSYFLDEDEMDSAYLKAQERRVSVFEHSADSALKYFQALWKVGTEVEDVIYFPIRQVECFLQRTYTITDGDSMNELNKNCYFPAWYFADLSPGWECDFTTHYLSEVSLSKWKADMMESQLSNLEEPCLHTPTISTGHDVYRFTWLRSFDDPIAIRIEAHGDDYRLTWKVGKGYGDGGIKRKGKKRVSAKNWGKFVDLVAQAGFEQLSNETYVPMTDGASWTLEHRTASNFKAHNTNVPGGNFKESCLFLLKLTRLNIKEKDIY